MYDILLKTTTNLQEADLYLAIEEAERTSIAAISPIKADIVKKVNDELENRLSARFNKTSGSCQGTTLDPLAKIADQPSLCDPETLLRGLTNPPATALPPYPLTIDFQSAVKPKTAKSLANNPDYDFQLGRQKYQLFNLYNYQLTASYIGTEVIQKANSGDPLRKIPPQPRIEMYRYLVHSDIDSQTYARAFNELAVNFDVFVTVAIYPEDVPSANCPNNRKPSSQITILLGYTDCSKVDTNGNAICVFVPVRSDTYKTNCTNNVNTDFCKKDLTQALQNCSNPPCVVYSGTLSNSLTFAVGSNKGSTSANIGCISRSGSNFPGFPGFNKNTFTWSITVKPIGIGNNIN